MFTQDAYEYRAILTNDFDQDTKSVAAFYNQRGNMERQFDILKNDFGWDNMPFSSLNKNLVFLYLTAIFRNLYHKIIWHFSKRNKFLKPTFRMKKFIFRFITLPAKWVKQSRQLKLRIYSLKDYRVIHLASVKFENGIVVPVLPFVQSICGKYYLQTEIGLCENYTH